MLKVLNEFKRFLLRGNAIDLAVGVVVGTSFATIVNALVSDLLTPLIAVIAKVPDFGKLSFTVNGSRFMYGHFINTLTSFIIFAGTIFFFVIKPMNMIAEKIQKKPPTDPTTKKCKECLSEIPLEAKRCSHCTQITT